MTPTSSDQRESQGRPIPYPWLFLGLYFLFCLLTYRDYGITCDEPAIYGWGIQYSRYYFLPWLVDNLSAVEDATHNYLYPAFLELFCSGYHYTALHLLNLLFGSVIFIAVYQVLFAGYQKVFWALTGCVFLFLTPRFLGELAANPKDTPFAVLYFAALAGIYLIPRKIKGWGLQSFWIGVLIGLATCVRIMGLTLLPIFALYRCAEYFQTAHPAPGKSFRGWLLQQLPQWGLVILFSQLCMRMLWPYLDHDYFQGMWEIFRQSHDYYWDGIILFAGKMIHPSARLWTYLPSWFLLTTPLFILIGLVFPFFRKKEKAVSSLWNLLFLALSLNLALYLALKPIVYNGLRHYLFLVPVLSVMAAIGWIEFFRGSFRPAVKKIAVILLAANVLMTAAQCVRLYPYDYIYFNEIAGGLPGAYGKYETDYYGASVKKASEWLAIEAAKEPNRIFKVKTWGAGPQSNYYFGPNMRDQGDFQDADYWIASNQEEEFQMTPDMKKKIVYSVEREGVPLVYVLKLK